MIQMDNRLERYENGQDAEYQAYLNEPQEAEGEVVALHDERRHLMHEIRAIEGILAIDDKYSLVTPAHWNERLVECKARIEKIDGLLKRQMLIEEQAAIQGTIDLHCAGLIKCNTRFLEIAEELKQMEVS